MSRQRPTLRGRGGGQSQNFDLEALTSLLSSDCTCSLQLNNAPETGNSVMLRDTASLAPRKSAGVSLHCVYNSDIHESILMIFFGKSVTAKAGKQKILTISVLIPLSNVSLLHSTNIANVCTTESDTIMRFRRA